MNNYRKFVLTVLFLEIVLFIGCNLVAGRVLHGEGDRKYRVDVERAVEEMKQGVSAKDIDLEKYDTITDIRLFVAEEVCQEDYMVEEVEGTLYRFCYRNNEYKQYRMFIYRLNLLIVICFLFIDILLWYIERKVITPFQNMNRLVTELAKGNLTVPMKEEKSRFFGRFLWGIDMLRETLEQNRERELELLKKNKTILLSISHDIKTPLSAIDLYTRALSENLYDSRAITGIEKNIKEIKKYIDELVTASREDFLHLEVQCREFYLKEMMKTIIIYYKEKMMQNHTEFVVDEVENCLLYGDLDRAVEVLQNVCENALKYGDGKQIHISFDEEEDCKLITVENSGCSLKEEEFTYIFDSFYRGSNSDKAKGSGLGLYICKSILHKMDGEIFAKEKNGMFAITVVLKKK